jgi:hypothetical protein
MQLYKIIKLNTSAGDRKLFLPPMFDLTPDRKKDSGMPIALTMKQKDSEGEEMKFYIAQAIADRFRMG